MKTVFITGASRGLGKALAEIFADNNHNLLGPDDAYRLILHCKNSELQKPIGIECHIVNGDLVLDGEIQKLASVAERRDIDILINNAGIYCNKPFSEMSEDDFRETIKTNLLAPMFLTRALWPALKKKSGLIININSHAGKSGTNGETAYCASKHGLRGFSSALQFDATKDGIRIIDVFLGAMKTDMTKGRENFDKLINPAEAAKAIFNLCENYQSLRITEIDISRRNY